MVTLRGTCRPLAIVCIAAVAMTVLAPGTAAIDLAPPSPEFVLLPQLDFLDIVAAVPVALEQSDRLRAAVPERAPPSA